MPVEQHEVTVVGDRLQDPLPVGGIPQGIHVVQQAVVQDQVEGLRHDPLRDVRLDGPDRDARLLRPALGELQGLRHEIEGRHVPALLREVHRVRAGATADVESTPWLPPLADLGEEQGGLVVGPGEVLPAPGPVVGGEEGFFLVGAHGACPLAG